MKVKKKPENKPEVFDVASNVYIPVTTATNNNSVEATNLQSAWTSDSDFSDNEVEKLALISQRIQQAALNLLAEAAKVLLAIFP